MNDKEIDFYDLDLNDNVLDALDAMNFQKCTPIQAASIPPILEGRDVIGIAQTGTGKTAAYLLPILSKLNDGGYPSNAINCIIMAPTRELAQQIDQAMEGFSYFMPFSSVAVYGGNDGVRYEQELKGLAKGADVIIATPGRLISHIKLGHIDLSKVSFFILDEADRMLDMGFSDDILTIVKHLNSDRQTILFSATMPEKIMSFSHKILHNPIEIKLAVSKPVERIQQSCYLCHESQKIALLKNTFKNITPDRVIIFASSKIKVKEVTHMLKQKTAWKTDEIHSDLDQKERDNVMYHFKSKQTQILVATDIISRGIDIDDIQMVINYDVPNDAEDYIHRIGRTARANNDGVAITLVSEKEVYKLKKIEGFLGKEIPRNELPEGMEKPKEYKEHNNHHKHSYGDSKHSYHKKKKEFSTHSSSKNKTQDPSHKPRKPFYKRKKKESQSAEHSKNA